MPGEVSEKSSHFIWHFVNQKRRRPFKKGDGKFNYSPDVYCSVYDETTGICPAGDDCPLLHRVAGDVERRYHPRYFKTCMCVHETDAKGHCVKNGPHCAYAHGPDDLRMPVFDASEDDNLNGEGSTNLLAAHLEKDIFYNEDPAWNDPHYVLINYKTEQCKRPHRLCRQGYACPSYHNPRDKRRSPKTFKYRSTPCPSVKRGDEWGDPPLCDVGDKCSYCHTRTEQQFHPEIYKSSKCNDMIQTGYCPRGQFCAFAHLEKELNEPWDTMIGSEASLSDFVEAVLPLPTATPITKTMKMESNSDICNGLRKSSLPAESHLMSIMLPEDSVASSSSPPPLSLVPHSSMSNSEPIGKRRTVSLSEGTLGPHRGLSTLHEKHAMKYPYDITKENLNQLFPSSNNSSMMMNTTNPGTGNILSPKLSFPSFYPGEETVESVIVNALDEEFVGGDLNLSGYDREESDSLCSSLSTSFPSFGGYFGGMGSRPMSIPTSSMGSNVTQQHRQQQQQLKQQQQQKDFVGSYNSNNAENSFMLFGRSYTSLAPIGSEHAAQLLLSKQQQQQQSMTSQLISELATLQNYQSQQASMNCNNQSSSTSSLFPSSSLPLSQGMSNLSLGRSSQEFEKIKEELKMSKLKMAKWEESACTAWMKEVDDIKKQKKILEDENVIISKQRDDAVATVAKLTTELDSVRKSKPTTANFEQQHQPQQQQQLHVSGCCSSGGNDDGSTSQQQQQQQQLSVEKDFTKLQQKRDLLKNELNSIEEMLKKHCRICQKKVTPATGKLSLLSCNQCLVCSYCCSTNSDCKTCPQLQQESLISSSSSDKPEQTK
ncbi:hypothetical protein HELRODRAFT_188708 [Helobdella robusta]|uniref:C3H1-type domain-containing protein n=1 Tax=Helobdella robusta TaxID=6412 RepID=T1FQA2_HELRO|nr:hypothetical protein HELRODRAFT_188708 [Helobdella robusta]ESO02446.1 hypothetical protein HELRODRAFT_188708 [Helobdella robusta]